MEKKHQIFISSTFADLKDERQAAVEGILAAGHIPAGMELFAAGDESQMEVIQRWIDDSDIYLLILGGRYGSTHPSTGMSYTEHEYEYAVARGKPFFALVLTDGAIKSKHAVLGDLAIEQVHTEKHEAFRSKVLSKISRLVDDCKDIKIGILESVRMLERKYSLRGWVRSDSLPDVASVLKQIAALNEENAELKAKIAEQPLTTLSNGEIELADLSDKIEVHYSWKPEFKSYERKDSAVLAWTDIFGLIAPKLLSGQGDNYMKKYLARQILGRIGADPYSCEVSEQDFHTLKVHLMALGLIKIEYLSTIGGGADLFWSLTDLGHKALLELRAVRKA